MKACEMCGCTDDRACEGGCFWVFERPALCSRCVLDQFAYAAAARGVMEEAASALLLAAAALAGDEMADGDVAEPALPRLWQPGDM